ncbi:MAG: hypothetical protein Q8N48_01860 [Thiobacillus sp.]|nr:hypothetical protein [Thiobacillus sp.]MDP2977556.1 hypothetical protein [Thiobacillus sp.]
MNLFMCRNLHRKLLTCAPAKLGRCVSYAVKKGGYSVTLDFHGHFFSLVARAAGNIVRKHGWKLNATGMLNVRFFPLSVSLIRAWSLWIRRLIRYGRH